MSIAIHIPTAPRPYTGGNARVDVEGGTVGEALARLTSTYPDLQRHIRTQRPQALIGRLEELHRAPKLPHRAPSQIEIETQIRTGRRDLVDGHRQQVRSGPQSRRIDSPLREQVLSLSGHRHQGGGGRIQRAPGQIVPENFLTVQIDHSSVVP